MYTFLLVLHALIAAALVGVILMQRSEGGGLAGGGSPAGLMTARGAADFLTRTTSILAIFFVGLSIAMAAVATMNRAPTKIDTSLAKPLTPSVPQAPAVPLAGGAVPPPPVESLPQPAQTVSQQVPIAASGASKTIATKAAEPKLTDRAVRGDTSALKREGAPLPTLTRPVVLPAKASEAPKAEIVPPVITAPLTKPAPENAPQ